jgi:molybdenum cofactor cytidylyltransferase
MASLRRPGKRLPLTLSFLRQFVRLSLATDFVVVVVGKNEAALAPIIYAQGASLVVNPDPDRGQFSSLQVGLHEVLNHGRDAAMVTLVDRPPVSTTTVQKLHDAFEAPPIIISGQSSPSFLASTGIPT